MAEQPNLAVPDKKLRTVTGWTIFFMVLLRMAIGWHFFYEGAWKLKQDGWQATSYLVVAQGPLRNVFRGMVEDVDGLKALTPEGSQARLETRYDQLIKHYGISDPDMLKRIGDFKDARKGAADKAPEYESVLAGASGRLADGVYADFKAGLAAREEGQPQIDLAEAAAGAEPNPNINAAKAEIESILDEQAKKQAELRNETSLFRTRNLQAAKNEDLSAAVQSFVGHRDYQDKLALRKANFNNEIRNFKLSFIESIFVDGEFKQQRDDYLALLAEVEDYENKIGTTAYNVERMMDMYGRKAAAKNAVLARADRPMAELDGFVLGQLNKSYAEATIAGNADAEQAAQAKLAKALPRHKSPTWLIDWANMLGLTAVGIGLMLGLFTRLSALGGVGLLMLYYWCMPSFPWLPDAGPLEGHYFFINKNIIEALALLVIATSGVGRWAGLDAFLSRPRAGAK